ncbi:helix-turn-helix domain-containing protein [Winogradskya humida]|uniref:Transcriptional regulator n=1 Tax=Winogradskya humida TaxID=113566 RepID=A0ABQ3ZRU1_9ACTN|nr:helix-turn-helix domain-containing protein [Actinoplanes humidus]GIE21304.1 hypothetical protein Ahu01nite_044060 [Actinoplanes humidus]
MRSDPLDEFREAAGAVGLTVESSRADLGVDMIVANPQGGQLYIQAKYLSLAAADGLEAKILRWSSQPSHPSAVSVLVADRVTPQARHILEAAGWGWLDLRGHLRLVGPGFFVDSDIPAARETAVARDPLAGSVGIEVAAALLLDPARRAPVRKLARMLGRAPSSVSQALKGLRQQGLIDEQGGAAIPDLFWQLAERWKSTGADVRTLPVDGDDAILKVGLEGDIETTSGWALTDTAAAARFGAPVGVRADHPPDFYVPDQLTLRRAVKLLGIADDHETRSARIKIAPVPFLCSRRVALVGERWRLARPLFVALDLAQDLGRGREILQGWTPDIGGPRVW